MDDEKSENAKNSENCPYEIFTSHICGYDDQTHVCMSGTRKHMSGTCFQHSEGVDHLGSARCEKYLHRRGKQ